METSDDARRAVLLLVLGTFVLRIFWAWGIGLGVDESYMVAAGRTLRLGYFDHPPASWWLSWGAAHLFGTEAPAAVRLPFVLLFALSTWLTYLLGRDVGGPRAGLWAAVAINLSPVFSVTSGAWVLPDGPLNAALLGAALCLMRALPAERNAWSWWAGAGACAGLALFSKYSAVLTIGGAGLYLLTQPAHRAWLKRPQPYAAAAVAALVFSPVVLWNAANGWASFAFQGARAGAAHFRPLEPLATLGGEALFVLPWIWLPMMALLIAAFRRGPGEPLGAWRTWLLAWLALPPIVAFAAVSAWSSQRVLYHWAAPGYLMLFPLLGDWLARHAGNVHVRRTVIVTAALLVLVPLALTVQLRTDALRPVLGAFLHGRDPDIEGVNWTSVRADLAARGLLTPETIVGVANWRDGGKLAYALGPDARVVVLNEDARQFGFGLTPRDVTGRDLLILTLDPPDRVAAEYGHAFAALHVLPSAPVLLAGRPIAEVSVARGERLLAWPPPAR
ncbi:MAG: glycosyltransferase family 39 protein [Proteobacteria bacterium]|nr:glycosyltransferase family 39 protein [Pseudomonadota bacterium]